MSIAPVTPPRTARVKQDSVLSAAVDLARSAALEEAEQPSHVGAHLGTYMVGERLAAHTFACAMRGYVGWEWTVTLARVPRGRNATVCEVHLLPTAEAILAPAWLPWAERLKPGDVGPGDVLPFTEDDPRLVEGYKATGNEEEDRVAIEELALARTRILSETGRDEAAQRWYEGTQGPRSQGALQSASSCGSCGFLVPLQGALGQVFGVCANLWSDDDGKVVALGHGCGAHSETDVPHRPTEWPENNPIIDETAIDPVTLEQLAQLPEAPREQSVDAENASDASAHDASAHDESAPEGLASEALASQPAAPEKPAVDEPATGITSAPDASAPETPNTPDTSAAAETPEGAERGIVGNEKDHEAAEKSRGSLHLELPQATVREPKLTREQALQNLDAIAQSLPQRGSK